MNVATAGDRRQELSWISNAAACSTQHRSQAIAAALKTHINFSSVFFDICFYFFSKLSKFFEGIPSYLRYDTVSQLTDLTS